MHDQHVSCKDVIAKPPRNGPGANPETTVGVTFPAPAGNSPRVDRLTVLVPVYNGEDVLDDTLRVFAEMLQAPPIPCELLFVDDGSTDGTWRKLREFQAGRANVHIIRLARNFGEFAALRAGFANARFDVIVSTEMNLEHDWHELFRLAALLSDDLDLVNARRVRRSGPTYRIVASWAINAFVHFVGGLPLRDANSILRVWRRESGLNISSQPFYDHYIRRLFAARTVEIPVDCSRRSPQRSRYRLRFLARAFFTMAKAAVDLRWRGPDSVADVTTTRYEIAEEFGAKE